MTHRNSLSSKEIQIIRLLGGDGRLPIAELARRVGVSEPTARRHLANLENNGYIHIVALFDPTAVGYEAPAYIGLDVERHSIREVASALADYEVVSNVVVATGPYDIIIEAVFSSMRELYTFVLEELTAYEGIKDSHSFIHLQRFKIGGVRTNGPDD